MGRSLNFHQIIDIIPSVLDLIFPPICLHCKTLLPSHLRFCSTCSECFELLKPRGRCRYCFSEITQLEGTCPSCRKRKQPLKKTAACFDCIGPGRSLLESYIRHPLKGMAKELAYFTILQMEALNYPEIEAICVVPGVFSTPMVGIAKQMAEILAIPFCPMVVRSRRKKSGFLIKKGWSIINKTVLLLDLRIGSCEDMRRCAWSLHIMWPRRIYGLTVTL